MPVPGAFGHDDASYPHYLSMKDGGVVACGKVYRRLDLLDGFQGRLCRQQAQSQGYDYGTHMANG
jgi:hypothetical protein